jgi:hypothetical protein
MAIIIITKHIDPRLETIPPSCRPTLMIQLRYEIRCDTDGEAEAMRGHMVDLIGVMDAQIERLGKDAAAAALRNEEGDVCSP